MKIPPHLQSKFGSHDHINFEQTEHGLVLIKIENALATATISLYGGQIIAWQPKSQKSAILWQPKLALYQTGKAIRGGVPICWPWFGPHISDPTLPAHGFARVFDWNLTSVRTMSSGETEICLTLSMHANDKTQSALRQNDFNAALSIRYLIGSTLSIELTTTNSGSADLSITEALHTYFNIGDIDQISIEGLDGCEYIDQLDGHQQKKQSGLIHFTEEVDRIYTNTTADCFIHDQRLERTIKISKSSSHSTVIWNPWTAKAAKMTDLGHQDWRTMVCVESANASSNKVFVPAGQQHTLAVNYSVTN